MAIEIDKRLKDFEEDVAPGLADFVHTAKSGTGLDAKVSLENLQNILYPIGATYLQLPGKDDPATLSLPGTWSNISSSFAGDFLRVEGGAASSFGSGQQLDQFQKFMFGDTVAGPTTKMARVIMFGGTTTASDNFYGPVPPHAFSADLVFQPYPGGATGTPRTGSETRPVNQTIRVWERIS